MRARAVPDSPPTCLMTSEHLWVSTEELAPIEKLCIGAELGDDITFLSVDECRLCGRIGPGFRTTWDTGLEPAVRARIARWLEGPQELPL